MKSSVPAISISPSESPISGSQDAVWAAWTGPQACGEPWWEVRGSRARGQGILSLAPTVRSLLAGDSFWLKLAASLQESIFLCSPLSEHLSLWARVVTAPAAAGPRVPGLWFPNTHTSIYRAPSVNKHSYSSLTCKPRLSSPETLTATSSFLTQGGNWSLLRPSPWSHLSLFYGT